MAGRSGFERLYDLVERVIPADILALPTLSEEDATRELVRRSVVALGVGTVKDIADYFRLRVATTRARLRELVAAGEVAPVRVEGWAEDAYLHARANGRGRVHARALLSPGCGGHGGWWL